LAVCARKHSKVAAFGASAEGSHDEQRLQEAADLLGVELSIVNLSAEELVGDLDRMKLPFSATLMDQSLWCLYSAVARRAASKGVEVILLGQLADELFGGYRKYLTAISDYGEERAQEMMDRDLLQYQERGKIRDMNAFEGLVGAELPYASSEVLEVARRTPMEFKIRGGERKVILRRAAEILGVPPGIASAPKKAAQYSTGIQKLVSRMTL